MVVQISKNTILVPRQVEQVLLDKYKIESAAHSDRIALVGRYGKSKTTLGDEFNTYKHQKGDYGN